MPSSPGTSAASPRSTRWPACSTGTRRPRCRRRARRSGPSTRRRRGGPPRAADRPAARRLVAAAGPARGREAAVNRAEAARIHRRATRLPATLAEDLARSRAQAHTAWLAAREADAFAGFVPALTRVVALKRAAADCLAEPGQTGYDALLDDYEPGATAAELEAVFGRLRPGPGGPRAPIAAAGRKAPEFRGASRGRPAGAGPATRRCLRLRLAGRPARSRGPPFLDRVGGDVRITTRINEADPRECLYSTVHEPGHALYEQGLDPARRCCRPGRRPRWACTNPVAAVREPARPQPGLLRVAGAGAGELRRYRRRRPGGLYRAVNRVETGFIRTEADEVHYNLHVMMRFDLERALIDGALEVADLEAAWNARFLADFGRAVPGPRLGVLQDVHWSVGLFGYFPTYTPRQHLRRRAARGAAPRPARPRRPAGGRRPGPGGRLARARVHRRGRLLRPAGADRRGLRQGARRGALVGELEAKYGELYGV